MTTRIEDAKATNESPFEEIDTTLNAVRLMMEAETRTSSQTRAQDGAHEALAEGAAPAAMAPVDRAAKKIRKKARGAAVFPTLEPSEEPKKFWKGRRKARKAEPAQMPEKIPEKIPGQIRAQTSAQVHDRAEIPAKAYLEPAAAPEFAPDSFDPPEFGPEHDAAPPQDAALGRGKLGQIKLPSPKVLIALAVVAIVWFRPWLIPGILFLLFWIALIVHLTVGPERMAEMIAPVRRFLARRFPDKAAAWRERMQNSADAIEGAIEKLPARWQSGVYLPDLGRSERDGMAEDQDDPFDRLADERAHGVG